MTQAKKPKVFWKAEELKSVSEYLVTQGVQWTSPNIIAHVRNAQTKVLPEERQRWVVGSESIKNVQKPLEDAWKRHNKAKERERVEAEAREKVEQEQREKQAREAIEAEERRQVEEAERQREIEAAKEAVSLSHPIDVLLNALAQEVAGRFVHYLRENMTELLGAQSAGLVNTILPDSQKVIYSRRRKVAVVGIPKNNESRIEREYLDLDLRTIHADHNNTKSALGSADVVIGMIDYISHSQKDILKKHPNFVPVNGGLDSLRHILNGIRNQKGN
jgi:hypothetical protein